MAWNLHDHVLEGQTHGVYLAMHSLRWCFQGDGCVVGDTFRVKGFQGRGWKVREGWAVHVRMAVELYTVRMRMCKELNMMHALVQLNCQGTTLRFIVRVFWLCLHIFTRSCLPLCVPFL